MVESNDLSDEDPILAMLEEELGDDSSVVAAAVDDEMDDTTNTIERFGNFNMNLSENCQIIIIVLLLIILFKEEIMKNKFVKSILN
tara:strand:+ start:284 stop:541 length:258 start_codon:yes stop_codon:yes gene_type:complete